MYLYSNRQSAVKAYMNLNISLLYLYSVGRRKLYDVQRSFLFYFTFFYYIH